LRTGIKRACATRWRTTVFNRRAFRSLQSKYPCGHPPAFGPSEVTRVRRFRCSAGLVASHGR
jgi:hypothetical protein